MTYALIYAAWFAGFIYTLRSAMLWATRSYARSGLVWDTSDTACHLAIFGLGGVMFWPLWWVGTLFWALFLRWGGGFHRRLLKESADNWEPKYGSTPKYVREMRGDS